MEGPKLLCQSTRHCHYIVCGAGKELLPRTNKAAFEYAQETETPLCAFLGDECICMPSIQLDIAWMQAQSCSPKWLLPLLSSTQLEIA